jgi:hypothetical protein
MLVELGARGPDCRRGQVEHLDANAVVVHRGATCVAIFARDLAPPIGVL